MPSPDTSESDPVDALLGAGGRSVGDDRLRQAVLDRTTGVIRRRRRLKRCALAAVLLGCYLAGVATTQLWRSPGGRTAESLARQSATSEDAALPAGVTAGAVDRRIAPPGKADFDDIRRLSDRYLHQQGNVGLALRYYARALNTASAEQRAISAEEDSWLLMALKQSRMKETRHDNGDS